MLIRHSLASASARGIPTPALIEYYDESQFEIEAEYEVGVLVGGVLDKSRILSSEEAPDYAEKLKKYFGKSTEVFFRRKCLGELAVIVSIRKTNEVEFSTELSEEDKHFIDDVVKTLTSDFDFSVDLHLIFHFATKEQTEMVLTEIKYGEN